MNAKQERIIQFLDKMHHAPLIWGVVLLLSLVALFFGEQRQESFLGAAWGGSFDASWKISTIIYLSHLTATVLSCLLLLRLNDACNLMQRRTLYPVTLLVFFNGCVPAFAGTPNIGILLLPVLVLLLYLLFGSYQSPRPRAAYDMGLLITGGALLWAPFIVLLPIFMVGLIYMQIFDRRTVTALLLGALTPLWLYFCAGIVFDFDPFAYVSAWGELFIFDKGFPAQSTLAMIAFLIATALIGGCCVLSDSYFISRHKIQIWRSNRFLVLLFVSLLAFSLNNSSALDTFLPLLHLIAAQTAAYYLIHAGNRYKIWQMGVVVAVYLSLYIWNF